MQPSSDCKKIATTMVFIGNKNVNLSHPASITRLLDIKKIMVSAGVSWEGKTNIVLLTLTDPRSIVKTTFNCWMTIFSQVVGEFILETIMYFTKMEPLHTQEG